MQGESAGNEDLFGDLLGGSETSQNPFSEDTFNLDAWNENEHPRDNNGQFSSGNETSVNKNQNFKNDIEEIIKNAKNNPNTKAKVDIGNVSHKLADEARKNGYNIEGYKHNVDVSGVRHIYKQHGIGNEKNKNQIPLTDDDLKKIPEIIYHYDKVTFGAKDNKGTDIIKYQKQMPDGEVFYLEEIRTGKKTLTTKTMYKKSR